MRNSQFIRKSSLCKIFGVSLALGMSLPSFAKRGKESPLLNLQDKFSIFEEDTLRFLDCEKTDQDAYNCFGKDVNAQANQYAMSLVRIGEQIILRGEKPDGTAAWVYAAKAQDQVFVGHYKHTGMTRNAAFKIIQ